MEKETTDEVRNIIISMNDENITKEVEEVKSLDPLLSLRSSIFNAFEKRLEIILKEEGMKTIVEQKLREKIDADELTVPQLMSLLNSIKTSSTVAMDSLLSVLKPTPNAISPLFATMGNNDEELINNFGNLDSEQSENVSKLIRLMAALQRTGTAEPDK
jgi:hypothetical protein